MKIEFKTWGGETIRLEGAPGAGYTKLTITSKDEDLPTEMSTTIGDEDAQRLAVSLELFRA